MKMNRGIDSESGRSDGGVAQPEVDSNPSEVAEMATRELANLFGVAQEALEAERWSFLADRVEELGDRLEVGSGDKLELLGSLLLRICERSCSLESSVPEQVNTAQFLVRKLLSLGGSLTSLKSRDQSSTCLMLATKSDQPALVNMFLEQAGDTSSGRKQLVNASDRFGWTALFYASYFGSFECGRKLIESGAQVNLVDCDGVNCLIWASGRGHYAMVKLLVENCAHIGKLDRYNSSAFVWACRKGEWRIVELLIEHGAELDEPGMYGWTPLIAAVRGGHVETVRLLLAHRPASLDTSDGERMSPLLLACRDGQSEIGLELLRAGAQVNQLDAEGNSALILATKARCLDLLEALLERDAELSTCNQNDRDPIHWAIVGNHPDACQLLVSARRRRGLDIDHQTDRNGETYLMLAAKHRRASIIKLLLSDNNSQQSRVDNQNNSTPSNISCSRQQALPRLSLRPDDVF